MSRDNKWSMTEVAGDQWGFLDEQDKLSKSAACFCTRGRLQVPCKTSTDWSRFVLSLLGGNTVMRFVVSMSAKLLKTSTRCSVSESVMRYVSTQKYSNSRNCRQIPLCWWTNESGMNKMRAN